jgi:pyruvate kinase
VADILVEKGIVKKGNRIIISRGDLLGDEGGGTNAMKVVTIGNVRAETD